MRAIKFTFDIIKVFLLFTGCTILFYFAILWVNEEYQNYHRYDAPKEDSAVKVSTEEQGMTVDNWMQRMIFFYENGE
jgi:hypothetical protein